MRLGRTTGRRRGLVWGGTALLAVARMLVRARNRGASLAGQVALVTGGSRGLGSLIARELVDAGCHLIICARDGVALEKMRAELASQGADVMAVACDLSRPADVD